MNQLRIIEDYLEGKLSAQEKIKFECNLRYNSDLQKSVQLISEINASIMDNELFILYKIIKDACTSYSNYVLTVRNINLLKINKRKKTRQHLISNNLHFILPKF